MRKGLTALLFLALITGPAAIGYNQEPGSNEGSKTESPQRYERVEDKALAWGGFTGQISLSIIGAFIGAYAGSDIESIECGLGFITGSILGTAIGVYVVGTNGNETGSFPATLAGSALGVTGGCCAGLFVPPLLPLTASVGQVSGAIWAFNKTRRTRTLSETSAIFNFRDGRMSLAVPGVYLQPDSFGRRNSSQRVYLLKVRF